MGLFSYGLCGVWRVFCGGLLSFFFPSSSHTSDLTLWLLNLRNKKFPYKVNDIFAA